MEGAYEIYYELETKCTADDKWKEIKEKIERENGVYALNIDNIDIANDLYFYSGGLLIHLSSRPSLSHFTLHGLTLVHPTVEGLEKMAKSLDLEFDESNVDKN